MFVVQKHLSLCSFHPMDILPPQRLLAPIPRKTQTCIRHILELIEQSQQFTLHTILRSYSITQIHHSRNHSVRLPFLAFRQRCHEPLVAMSLGIKRLLCQRTIPQTRMVCHNIPQYQKMRPASRSTGCQRVLLRLQNYYFFLKPPTFMTNIYLLRYFFSAIIPFCHPAML